MSAKPPPPTAAKETEHIEPDLTEGARKRVMVAITVVLTVWGAIFLWVFAVWVAGTTTKMPPPLPGTSGGAPLPMGPAGPTVPLVPPGGEEPGHEGHGHAPGEHDKHAHEGE